MSRAAKPKVTYEKSLFDLRSAVLEHQEAIESWNGDDVKGEQRIESTGESLLLAIDKFKELYDG